ncbi:hypothetical protein [Ornithinimicrobium cerasi]|uniref:hypothetical protein n=1 Tax=Ornithinimicrobium cerasi TaxID=2248773 RepID=UPI00137AF796|nr:hypothetical protein [Ornithinimicrobium cerasi]
MSRPATAPAARGDVLPGTRRPRTGSVLMVAVVALSLVGLVVAAVFVAGVRARPVVVGIGSPVGTSGGSVVVTRVGTTFVPTTQGPPTAARMAGTEGLDQLQVWVELTATARGGLEYSEGDFRLVTAAGEARTPDGSTLGDGLLPRGGSVSGQVWFDDVPGVSDGWVEYDDPDGRAVRVALTPEEVVPVPAEEDGGTHHG